MKEARAMKEVRRHAVELCIVGGGIAGLCAALSAARRGVQTLLMHDRPVLGGNASSEVRMHISGSKRLLETGLVEELRLENAHANPEANWSLWDAVLFGKAIAEPNLTLLLNTTCQEAVMDGPRIAAVRGWQLTTYSWHEVEADCFADCSGDSILAVLSGAEWRIGREAADEFGEDIEPPVADGKTMGMSLLLEAREEMRPSPFVPFPWAHRYPDEKSLAHRPSHLPGQTNYWWIETGGAGDVLREAERDRDELVKIALGVWDHVKNTGDHAAANWRLEWMGFLPGKRESRRCLGDYILTQGDVHAGGRFPDIVAYSGWPMDDHHPDGFAHRGAATIFHPVPPTYGIPYRCLYSRNIENLFFAGRNISVTHAALSGTRVMATCALLGQAVGTAAALARRHRLATPREVGAHIAELQRWLMDDDATLPGLVRALPDVMRGAVLCGPTECEALLDGVERDEDGGRHAVALRPGESLTWRWPQETAFLGIRLVCDSDLGRTRDKSHLNMPTSWPLSFQLRRPPETLLPAFHIELEEGGVWRELHRTGENYQRLIQLQGDFRGSALRLTADAVRGATGANRIFAFDVTNDPH